MKNKEALNKMIDKILKEELDKHKESVDEETYAGVDAINTIKKSPKFAKLTPEGQKDVLDRVKKGPVTMENDQEVDSAKATDIAGQMSEVIDKLKNISEAPKDPKYKKHADKAMKYMEAAKSALEGLTDYETMLEEKDKQNQEKGASKKLKTIEKHLSKIIKDKNMVSKIMHKMPVAKVIELQSAAEKELDEEKIAKAMLNVALKEGFSIQTKK